MMRGRWVSRMAAGAGLALLLAAAPGAPWAQEAEGTQDAAAGTAENSGPDQAAATAAFNKLFSSAEERLRAAGPRLKAVRREVLVEMEAFPKEYPGTAAAAVSLENAGDLARVLGEPERAEALFREALLHRPPEDIYSRIAYGLSNLIAMPGREIRDFTADTLDGGNVSPEGLKGKVVLLDFWATWCGPCIAELPNLQKAFADYHDQGFEIVSISVDEDRAALDGFLRENKMPWKHVADVDRPTERRLADSFAVYGIPHTILVGKDGKIVARDLRGEALGAAVKQALGE